MASRYYVVGEDGQRYGPADLATLNRWIRERRLLPSMHLVEESTGLTVLAGMVAGLDFNPGFDSAPRATSLGGYPTPGAPTDPVGN